jgi:hypothetical protein
MNSWNRSTSVGLGLLHIIKICKIDPVPDPKLLFQIPHGQKVPETTVSGFRTNNIGLIDLGYGMKVINEFFVLRLSIKKRSKK